MIPLENIQVREVKNDKKKVRFELCSTASTTTPMKAAKFNSGALVKGHHKSYLIQSSSSIEREAWMKAINGNIHRNPFYDLLQAKHEKGK